MTFHSEPDPLDAAWDAAIRRHLESALEEEPSDFARLLQMLPSVDPLTAWTALRHLARHGDARAASLLRHRIPSPRAVSALPIAHPLEYDWRFAPEATAVLLTRLAELTAPGESIGYLGAPTAYALGTQQMPDRRHVLFDRSTRRLASATEADQVVGIDLLEDALPAHNFAAAVADPPWYPEHLDAFLWVAAYLLRAGGTLIASFPPDMTRPGISGERETIRQNALRAGLVVVDQQLLSLRYQTPPFETAAYNAAGVPYVPDNWRRGDMLTLRKDHPNTSVRPTVKSTESGWEFVEIEQLPFAIKPSQAAAPTDFLIEPAVEGAVLPTVSRRHPARASACLWSSRNRVYRSSNPPLLASLLRGLANGANPAPDYRPAVTPHEQEKLVAAANQLRELVVVERLEHGLKRERA